MIPNILVSVSGLPKSGKTHFAFTFPEPIKVFSYDVGADFVARKFPDKTIDIVNFTMPILETDDPEPWAEPIWDEFINSYKEAAYSGDYQTIVLDTATAVWALCRQAITEKKNRKKLLEVEYALPNLKMTALWSHARESGVNLVTTQYLRDKYIKGENTGNLELNGFSNTEGLADVVIWIEEKDKAGRSVSVSTILRNRFDRDMNRQVQEDLTYDDLIVLLFPEEE